MEFMPYTYIIYIYIHMCVSVFRSVCECQFCRFFVHKILLLFVSEVSD